MTLCFALKAFMYAACSCSKPLWTPKGPSTYPELAQDVCNVSYEETYSLNCFLGVTPSGDSDISGLGIDKWKPFCHQMNLNFRESWDSLSYAE